MEKKTYGSAKEILKYPELCAATSVVLDRTAFAAVADANGGVVPAGTFVNFDLKDRAVKATPADESNPAVGVLRYDVVLASKEADGAAAVFNGIVDLAKLPVEPTAAQETELRNIIFMR